LSDNIIIKNLEAVIKFKKENPDKVELLLGNHDIQYIYPWNQCSWFRKTYAIALRHLYIENRELFKIMHREDNYYFSHAWLTTEWIELHNTTLMQYWNSFDECLNNILGTIDQNILFQCWKSRGWRDKVSWPLWADKLDTIDYVPRSTMIQVVWHTPVKHIEINPHIIYCDTLEHWDKKPLILTI
jgi:hypothetical protein